MTNNIPQIMTLSANNIFKYCEKKENNVSVKHRDCFKFCVKSKN